jgi:hypothetical protein
MVNSEPEPQCYKCKHFMQNSSCGSCVNQGIKQIQSILNEGQESPDTNKIDLIETLKYSCRIVVNDPNDFNVVNPLKCKYFFSNALNFR